jgi:hypothetical protein
MKWLIIPMVLATDVSYPPFPVDGDPLPAEYNPTEDVDDCERGVKDLKKSVLGLEFFLQDKRDHKIYCPFVKWDQPALSAYKEDPKSYLPKKCMQEII